MSGGHFNGQERQLQTIITRIAENQEFRRNLKKLSPLLISLGEAIRYIIQQYDYHLEGDAYIDDMQKFEEAAIKQIYTIVYDCLTEGHNDD